MMLKVKAMKDDLIKRSDAIGAFVAETNGVNVEKAIKVVDAYLQIRECDEVWDSIRAIRDCLECAKDEIAEYIPSADRPQGTWFKDDEGTFICSACGSGYKDQPTLMGKPMFKWCPICGARMKGADYE